MRVWGDQDGGKTGSDRQLVSSCCKCVMRWWVGIYSPVAHLEIVLYPNDQAVERKTSTLGLVGVKLE